MLSHAYRITRPARFQRSAPHRRRQGTHPCPWPRWSSRSHRSGCKERRQKTAAGARTPSVSGIVSFAFFFWQTQKRPLSGRTEGVKLRGTTSGLPVPRGRRPWEVRDFSAVTGAPVLPYCTARQGCRALQAYATGRNGSGRPLRDVLCRVFRPSCTDRRLSARKNRGYFFSSLRFSRLS